MKDDPVAELRDLLVRRDLTPHESRRLADWLRDHPEAGGDWEVDERISGVLRRLPDEPVPDRFTARVLAEVGRGERRRGGESFVLFDWRNWLHRHWATAGSVALVALASGIVWQTQVTRRNAEFARQVAPLRVLGEISPAILEDYDAIRRFAERPAPVDFELLAALQP